MRSIIRKIFYTYEIKGKALSKVSQCHTCNNSNNIIENCNKDYKNFYKKI